MIWRQLQEHAVERLRAAGVEAPELEARRLVERATGCEGAAYIEALGQAATTLPVRNFTAMLDSRLTGRPLQYVVGSWGFRTLDLLVDERVLIPRPETEVVAGAAIGELRRLRGDERSVTAVDLGTGSGAIALAIAVEVVRATVWATDVSPDALAVARANLAGTGRAAARVRLGEGDWFAALPEELRGAVDVVVANPPYVAADEQLPPEVAQWEPSGALVSGPSGTEHLARIVAEAPSWLTRPGALVVELAPWQAEEVAALAHAAGFDDVDVRPDLAGRERMVVARLG